MACRGDVNCCNDSAALAAFMHLKTEARSNRNSKTKHPELENEAPSPEYSSEI